MRRPVGVKTFCGWVSSYLMRWQRRIPAHNASLSFPARGRNMQEHPENEERFMIKDSPIDNPHEPALRVPRTPLPVGYRQGIITAITVLLGFSLLFVRYWDFELQGAWSVSSIIAAVLMTLAIVLQLVALWRSLQVKDDDEI